MYASIITNIWAFASIGVETKTPAWAGAVTNQNRIGISCYEKSGGGVTSVETVSAVLFLKSISVWIAFKNSFCFS